MEETNHFLCLFLLPKREIQSKNNATQKIQSKNEVVFREEQKKESKNKAKKRGKESKIVQRKLKKSAGFKGFTRKIIP